MKSGRMKPNRMKARTRKWKKKLTDKNETTKKTGLFRTRKERK